MTASQKKASALTGFTLIELTIVIALTALAGLFMVPIAFSFVQVQLLHETTSGVIDALRKAHNQSVTVRNGSSYGVKVLEDSYVLFEGTSYATRIPDNDESAPIPSTIFGTGITEVVFDQISGTPSVSGTLTFGYDDRAEEIKVRSNGLIER